MTLYNYEYAWSLLRYLDYHPTSLEALAIEINKPLAWLENILKRFKEDVFFLLEKIPISNFPYPPPNGSLLAYWPSSSFTYNSPTDCGGLDPEGSARRNVIK